MDASQLPKGQSPEKAGDGRPRNEPGTYHHKGAGKIVYTQPGNEGVLQADALVRLGYTRTGDVPSRAELLEMQKAQLEKDLAEAAAEKAADEVRTAQAVKKAKELVKA